MAVNVVDGKQLADSAVGRNGLIRVIVEPGVLIVRDRLRVLLLRNLPVRLVARRVLL
eukprot:CAMPEP_0176278458 /NCGR_PEP_ID=MMETSP0121_2-20121125/48794_1 /TAXON_ID=160619 /ORGANISM="Kryptoperidinium foliaceum, Strain CCMP 1326" /LENGTH=56 /DNA_ID=CAMNT_0017618771 /DNA_START=15 /DNA_END=182 /DNA_ORIENTATION=-